MKNIKSQQEFITEGIHGMHPKSNLAVGTFLVNYYRGKSQPKSGTIYRIHSVGHSDYSAFEISHHDAKQMSRSISDNEIIGTEAFIGNADSDWCFEVVSEEFIKKLVVQKTKKEVVDFLVNLHGSITGIGDDKDKKRNHYENQPPKELSFRYVLKNGGALETLVSIYDGFSEIVNIYSPFMDFPGDFGGNKPVKFD